MRCSIVIPNYNGEKILTKSFQTVIRAAETYGGSSQCEILYVDDGSTDMSIGILEKLVKEYSHPHVTVRLVVRANNGGFSHAVNSGVNAAIGEVIVLLNTDVFPKRDFLSFLLPHFTSPDVFAVGCLEYDESIPRGRGIGRWERGFLMHSRGEVDKKNTLWVNGGSGAFRKKIWDTLGGMQELYDPFYWEDIDLSYRALKAGYQLVFEPKSVVTHAHTEGAIKQLKSHEQVVTTAYRNQFFFVWLNITDRVYLLNHLCWLPYHIIKAVLRGDKAFLLGFSRALRHAGKVRIIRRKNKKIGKISDAQIVKGYRK